MTNVDRSLRARTSIFSGRNRNRFHAITAGVALAFVTGLSAPAMAATTSDVASDPVTVPVSSSQTSSVTESAIAKLTGQAPTSADDKAAAEKKAADKKAAQKKAAQKKVAAPTYKQLHPRGIPSGQQSFKPSDEQLRNAREIVKAGQKLHLSPRAQVIAMATALQESALKNLGHLGDRNDHDSQGLFQQRPSSGWGTVKQITTPSYAATAFYKGLINVDDWDSMKLTDAAQAVQVSAFPDHYAKWEKQAGDLVKSFYGAGPYAEQAAKLK